MSVDDYASPLEANLTDLGQALRDGSYRPQALRRVDELLHTDLERVVDADLKSCFDTIPHEQLMRLAEKKVADGRVLALVELFLGQSILDGMSQWTPDAGTPQGVVLSPLLSNPLRR